MSRDDYVQVSDPITSAAGTYRVRVDSDPYNNRSMPTDFAYVVEQECCAHDDCDCECWRETDRAGTGYESASDAMIAGRAAVPYEPSDSQERVLSEAARAVIAGLIAPSSEVNKYGIIADDGTWDEIRRAFPVSLFREWAAGRASDGSEPGYWPHAGY